MPSSDHMLFMRMGTTPIADYAHSIDELQQLQNSVYAGDQLHNQLCGQLSCNQTLQEA